jgi:hypothetical protein
MGLSRRYGRYLVLAVVNAAALLAYLSAASKTWLPADERGRGLPTAAGDGIYWGMTALPVLLLALLLNLAWMVFTRGADEPKRHGVLSFVIVGAGWIAAILLDRHMQQ